MHAKPWLESNSHVPQGRFVWRPHAAEDFKQPITIIETDHAHQLAICDVLDRLLRNPRHGADAEELAAVHDYLCHQLPLHVADEEEDLFDLLRRHAAEDFELASILDQLRQEHGIDRRLNDDLSRDIGRLVDGRAFTDPARFMMTACTFTETQRRHLAWEDTLVVTRARKLLTQIETAELGARMAERRGIKRPKKGDDIGTAA